MEPEEGIVNADVGILNFNENLRALLHWSTCNFHIYEVGCAISYFALIRIPLLFFIKYFLTFIWV